MNTLFLVTTMIREENNDEFLKPEITFNTNCADAPTFGRFSTMYDYPTKGITQASLSIQKKHVNLGCITTCDWETYRLMQP